MPSLGGKRYPTLGLDCLENNTKFLTSNFLFASFMRLSQDISGIPNVASIVTCKRDASPLHQDCLFLLI